MTRDRDRPLVMEDNCTAGKRSEFGHCGMTEIFKSQGPDCLFVSWLAEFSN